MCVCACVRACVCVRSNAVSIEYLYLHCNGYTDPPVSAATMCMLHSVVIYIRTVHTHAVQQEMLFQLNICTCHVTSHLQNMLPQNWSLCSVVLCGQRLTTSKVAKICHHYTITKLCDETSIVHVALLE